MAAKWFYRRFSDGLLRRAPMPEEVAAVEHDNPGVDIELEAHQRQRLSKLEQQDSYSYNLASITVGGADQGELTSKYERCIRALPFEFDD